MTRYCYLHGTQDCEICAAAKQAEWYCRHGISKLIAEHKALRAEVERLREAASLLRECRLALDDLLRDKPMLAAKLCGTTTLGNLRAMLYEYRPQGVLGATSAGDHNAPAV